MTEAQHAARERQTEMNDTEAEREDLPPENFEPEPPPEDSAEDEPRDGYYTDEHDPEDLQEQQDFAQDDGPFSDFGDDY